MPVRGKNAGNFGQGGKWIWPRTRRRIYWRDGMRCVYCGCSEAAALSLDHVLPRSGKKDNAPSNLVTACIDCNRERGDRCVISFAFEHLSDPESAITRVIDAMGKPLPT